jgi:hypothetical protein
VPESYDSLQDWMEAKGVNAKQLIDLMREAGEPLSKGHMSDILKGSRQCSLRKAVILSGITGGAVRIESIKQWPKVRKFRLVRSVA